MTGWATGLKPGLYVATLSRRALTALVSDVYGWNDVFEEYHYPAPGEEGYIPPASLTDVTLSSDNTLAVHMLARLPDQVEDHYRIVSHNNPKE